MKIVLKRLMKDNVARLCLSLIAVILFLGALAPILPIANPNQVDIAHKLLGPSAAHWLGTDLLGRDLLSRLIWGIRSTVYTAILTMLCTSILGALYGAIAGASGEKTDQVMMRLCDILMSFPSEVMILAIVGMLGPGLPNVILACIVAKWPWYARMMRTLVRKLTQSNYVSFARVVGLSSTRILFKHLIPGAMGEFFVLMTLDTGSVILMISALSFLGLGVQPPTAEWGMMLAETKDILTINPYQMIPAGAAILIVVAAFNFLGDALRDAFDLRHIQANRPSPSKEQA